MKKHQRTGFTQKKKKKKKKKKALKKLHHIVLNLMSIFTYTYTHSV